MSHMLKEFPSSFETERLLIRMPQPGDGKVVADAINASLTELKQWMAFAQKPVDINETEENIRKSHAQFLLREDLRLLVFHKEEGFFIGSSGLHDIEWEIPKFEIGYWIDSRHAKKGYMTEAVKAISDFAFTELGAKRVEIQCDALNVNSRGIPERLGFPLEGLLKNDELSMDGKSVRDTCIFAITEKL